MNGSVKIQKFLGLKSMVEGILSIPNSPRLTPNTTPNKTLKQNKAKTCNKSVYMKIMR